MLHSDQKLLKEVNIKLGNFKFYSNYIIGKVSSHQEVVIEKLLEVFGFTERFYGNEKKFGYISNRENVFSSKAITDIYTKLPFDEFTNFVGFAIVAYNQSDKKIAYMEQQIVHQKIPNFPFEIFSTMEDAKYWLSMIIKKSEEIELKKKNTVLKK